MKNRRNYYRILHVQPDAPQAIIKASYRTLMQKLRLHPDLGGDEWNASLLNEAYAVLSSDHKRSAYDRQFLNTARPAGPGKRAQQPDEPHRRNQSRGATATPPPRDNSVCQFCGTPKPARFRYGGRADCSRCSSPLQTVVQLRAADNTQRLYQRMKHRAPLRFFTRPTDQQGQPGIISNLSPRGMQLLASERLQEDQVIRIVSGILSATARVSHCRPRKMDQQYVVGVEFLTLCFHEGAGTFISVNA